jgi:Zn-dependent peptidase ImmA (M78 family)/transcriptional regulator with XRE-family HTH domain
MLRLAREAEGLSQTALAEKAGITQNRVSRMEKGLIQPRGGDLQTLADVLRVRKGFFFRNTPVRGLPESFYKRRKTTPKMELRRVQARFNIVRMNLDRLFGGIDLTTPFEVPDLSGMTPAGAARVLRNGWDVPNGRPIHDLVALVEDSGTVIYEMSLPAKVFGMSDEGRGDSPAMIVVSPGAPTSWTRFTIAHELGHLVLHSQGLFGRECEQEADEFAAEFLAPADAFLDDVPCGHLRLDDLKLLKHHWRISLRAVVYRLHALERISEGSARFWFQRFNKLGISRTEPVPLTPERPRLLRMVLEYYTHEFGYSADELSAVLDQPASRLLEEHPGVMPTERPKLRLIKAEG